MRFDRSKFFLFIDVFKIDETTTNQDLEKSKPQTILIVKIEQY